MAIDTTDRIEKKGADHRRCRGRQGSGTTGTPFEITIDRIEPERIAELPVMLATVSASTSSRLLSVDMSAFEFVSANSQIASVREFMRSWPEALSHSDRSAAKLRRV
jgi:hypothetical protein